MEANKYVILDTETQRFLCEELVSGPYQDAMKFDSLEELIEATPYLRKDAYIDSSVFFFDGEKLAEIKWIEKHRERHPYF
jgi:hypothetical protein